MRFRTQQTQEAAFKAIKRCYTSRENTYLRLSLFLQGMKRWSVRYLYASFNVFWRAARAD